MSTAIEGLIWEKNLIFSALIYTDLQAKQEGRSTCICIHKLRDKTQAAVGGAEEADSVDL